MLTITVENSTGMMLHVGDRYVFNLELNITYEGPLRLSIPHGKRRVIDYFKFIEELKEHGGYPQIISVVAGNTPELILRHSDFSGNFGSSLVFTLEYDVNGAPRLVHSFVPGNVGDGDGGGVTASGKIWNFFAMRAAAFFT